MMARPKDTISCAFYIALRQAIIQGRRGLTDGSAWLGKWGPVLGDLDRLIAEIPVDVRETAARIHIILAPVA
jgi:hypothetical protein